MKILAIESSSLVASAAVLDEEKITALCTSNNKKNHSETLLPMIDEALRISGTQKNEIEAIAVSKGPGSFTGLRIGGTTAKSLAMALDIPVIPVPTVDALAYNMLGARGLVVPIMDAKRGEVYTGIYKLDDDFEIIMPQTAMPITELLDLIKNRYTAYVKFTFLGDGVPVFKQIIEKELGAKATFAAPHMSAQSAASVATLGAKLYAQGGAVTADDFVPQYLRQSQAEREYVSVRRATSEDAAIIAGLEAACFNSPWDEASLAKMLGSSCYEILIAIHDEEPLGYCISQKVCGDGELLRIGVIPQKRRAGIGERLMNIMEDDQTMDQFSLEVRAANAPAIGLYQKLGYKALRVRQDYYSDPVDDALCMEKLIRK